MAKILVALALPVAVLLAGCGAAPEPDSRPGPQPEPPAEPSAGTDRLYEGNGMVCDDGERGPLLWLGGFRAVLLPPPPECGGVPLANWDWQAVEGEETAKGTTWGSYHVVGRFEGAQLVVTDAGPPQTEPEPDLDTSSPCREPDGGWSGAELTQEDDDAAHAYARAQPEYVTSWGTHLEPEEYEFSPVVLNVVFTHDAERHRREIAKLWAGPLCVVERDVPTARELMRIRKEVEASLDELGLEMLWSGSPGVEPVVEIGVVVDLDGRAQAALDARYGTAVVRLVPALTPVS